MTNHILFIRFYLFLLLARPAARFLSLRYTMCEFGSHQCLKPFLGVRKRRKIQNYNGQLFSTECFECVTMRLMTLYAQKPVFFSRYFVWQRVKRPKPLKLGVQWNFSQSDSQRRGYKCARIVSMVSVPGNKHTHTSTHTQNL